MREKEIAQLMINVHKKNFIITWATGMGKSKAALDLVNKIKSIEKKELKILLLVNEIAHKNNWVEEFTKWNFNLKVRIECYASLKKLKDSSWDCIIFDEGHHLFSPLRLKIINTITSEYKILLSASLNKLQLAMFESYCNNEYYYSDVELSKAIDNNILSEPDIFLIPLNLKRLKETEEIILGNKKSNEVINIKYKDRFKYVNSNLRKKYKIIIKCTEEEKNNYYDSLIDFYIRKLKNSNDERNREKDKNRLLHLSIERKTYLGELKTKYVKEFLKTLNKRYICFCCSIKQSEELNLYNSLNSSKRKPLELLNSYNKGEIDNLFLVNMLQEGMNLKDTDIGIIIQLDSTNRSFIQKFGRILRSKNPIQYIFFFKNTRDETFLNDNVLSQIDKRHINYLNIYV